MKKFLEEYIGRIVTDENYQEDDTYEESIASRTYDEDAEGEEANWSLSVRLLVTVEDGKVSELEPSVDVYCPGDDGLGDVDPYDYWSDEDDDAARKFLDGITQA